METEFREYKTTDKDIEQVWRFAHGVLKTKPVHDMLLGGASHTNPRTVLDSKDRGSLPAWR